MPRVALQGKVTWRITQAARAECNPLVLIETPVLTSNVQVAVRQRDTQIRAEATYGAGLLRPGMMRVLRVDRDGCIWV